MKKIRNILICINLIFVLCFLAALFVPVERKDTLYSSTDASIYDKKYMIPKLGAITDLISMQSNASINETELYLKTSEKQSGKYTLLLQGKNISPETRVALYGSRNADHMLSYVNANSDNVADIFYSLEVMEPQHPYIWMAAMILSMSLLFSYLIYSDLKEKKQ